MVWKKPSSGQPRVDGGFNVSLPYFFFFAFQTDGGSFLGMEARFFLAFSNPHPISFAMGASLWPRQAAEWVANVASWQRGFEIRFVRTRQGVDDLGWRFPWRVESGTRYFEFQITRDHWLHSLCFLLWQLVLASALLLGGALPVEIVAWLQNDKIWWVVLKSCNQAVVAFAGCFSNSKCGEPAFQRQIQIQGGLMSTLAKTGIASCILCEHHRRGRGGWACLCAASCASCACSAYAAGADCCMLQRKSMESKGSGDEIFKGNIITIPFQRRHRPDRVSGEPTKAGPAVIFFKSFGVLNVAAFSGVYSIHLSYEACHNICVFLQKSFFNHWAGTCWQPLFEDCWEPVGNAEPKCWVDTSTVCQTFYAFTASRLPDSTLKIRKVQASALLLSKL